MTENIKVSIIIPVYNTEKYLKESLDSITNQTLKDIEIICVNDGSTDNSINILNEYSESDSRFIIITQENQGLSGARNTGMKIARGEYIGFLDSDDVADLTMFEKMYKNAKEYDSDITMCSITVLNEKTGEKTTNDPYMTLDLFSKEFENKTFNYRDTKDFIFRICVTAWNKIYKNSFLKEKNLTFPKGLIFEDNVFFYQTFMQATRASIVKEPLIVYRRESDTSLTFCKNDYKKLDFFKIFEKIEDFLKEQNFYEEYGEYFEKHKKNTFIYWYKKLTNEDTKKEYANKFKSLYQENIEEVKIEKINKYH